MSCQVAVLVSSERSKGKKERKKKRAGREQEEKKKRKRKSVHVPSSRSLHRAASFFPSF
jgi:hypothetical protein